MFDEILKLKIGEFRLILNYNVNGPCNIKIYRKAKSDFNEEYFELFKALDGDTYSNPEYDLFEQIIRESQK